MGKQNKRVKAEAEDGVIFNTELRNKKQKKDIQQASGDPYNKVKNERGEVKAEDVGTPHTEQKKQQQQQKKKQKKKQQQQKKKENQQAVGGKNNEVKSEPVSTVANVSDGPVAVSDNASKGSPRKKTEKTQIEEKEFANKNVPAHVVEPVSNGAGKKRKRKQKKKQEVKQQHQAVGGRNNIVKIEPVSTVANVSNGPSAVSGNASKGSPKKKVEKTEIEEKELSNKNVPDHVVEPPSNGAGKKRKRKQKKKQEVKQQQEAVGGKNNEVKSEPVSTVADVSNGPVAVSENASKGSPRKKAEKTQIEDKELAKKNVPDHVVEPTSNGVGKKRKRKQKKKQEVANENAKTNLVEKGSSGTEDQIREGFEAATDSKTIVVSGLPFNMKEKKIFKHFKDCCGFITQISMYTFSEGENTFGLVFIEFEAEDAAKRALGLDGTKLGDRSMKVELSKVRPKKKSPPAKISGCKIAYIGNLPRVVKEDDIRQFFKDSKIESVTLALYRTESCRCCGFGHVAFADDESLENAMKKDNTKLYDRPIKVAYPVKKYAEPSKETKKVQDV